MSNNIDRITETTNQPCFQNGAFMRIGISKNAKFSSFSEAVAAIFNV